MLEDFTVETFEGLVGQTFPATPGDGGDRVELELVRTQSTGQESPHRAPFSVTFRHEGGAPVPQQVWTIEHAELGGEVDLFMVPHGADASGVEYGAHFN